ncbi:MAG TPA: transposase, partial [Epsilonproteobacteria bacterium]|nr:transposase [Campylobacterota bacterium]
MTLSTLTQQLDTLGFSGFKAALLRQSEDANYTRLCFEERLYQLLEAEQNERRDKKIKRLLSQAKLKDRQASLDAVEYSAKRGLERSQILSLASGEYITKGQNVLITGATGTGKSFLAQALAKQAIFEGYSARYYRVTRLLEEIKISRLEGSYTKTLQKLSRINLLILDDFGVTPLKADELSDLFEVIEERTLSGSTIITAQLPVKEWHSYLGNATIADAMMDRLIYSAHRIEMKGESMRKVM